LITNDIDPVTLSSENIDIPVGHYRTLDLTGSPFYIKAKTAMIYRSGNEIKQVILIENPGN
jgi:hypothetical protein